MQGSAVLKSQQHAGLQRLSALAGMVRSSAGPNKKYKFIQDDTSGESVLVCSCFRILENLEPTCAVGQLVFETIQAHHKIYRSGSGCLLFLAGAWSCAALECLRRGISVGQIISFMSEGMDMCIDVCKKSSVLLDVAVKGRHGATPRGLGLQRSEESITGAPQVSCHTQGAATSDHKTLNVSQQRKMKLSRHFYETKSESVPAELHPHQPEVPEVARVAQTLSHGCDGSMKLVTEAVQMQSKANRETIGPTFDLSKVMTCVLPGLPEDRACVLQGCVVLLSHQQTSVAHRIQEQLLKVALINGDLSHTYRHLGFKKPPGVRRVGERLDSTGSSKEDEWLDQAVGVFLNLEVNLVLTAGLACEQLVQRCCSHHILVVEKVNSSVLGTISTSFGAVPVTYATQLSKRCVGTGARVFIWRDLSSYERGSVTAASVSTGRDVGLVTAVITGCLHGKLQALEDQFWACSYRVHHALKDGALLPGAGGAEALCIHRLRKEAESHAEEGPDRVQRTEPAASVYRGDVLRLMADGFVEWITAVMTNAGRLSPVEARTAVSRQLQNVHRDRIVGGKFSQLALEGEREASAPKPDEAEAAIICDNLSVKLEAWRKALDLVFLVLQTDAEVITGTAHNGKENLVLL